MDKENLENSLKKFLSMIRPTQIELIDFGLVEMGDNSYEMITTYVVRPEYSESKVFLSLHNEIWEWNHYIQNEIKSYFGINVIPNRFNMKRYKTYLPYIQKTGKSLNGNTTKSFDKLLKDKI